MFFLLFCFFSFIKLRLRLLLKFAINHFVHLTEWSVFNIFRPADADALRHFVP